MKEKIREFYDKNYKKLIILPALLLILSLGYLVYFYIQTGDIINKDVSLTGGTTITLFTQISSQELKSELSKTSKDISVNSISDETGKQTSLVIITKETPEVITPILEKFLGYQLTEDNSSLEFTGSGLSKNFYNQLLTSIFLAFFWMSCVVFVIFSHKFNLLAIILNLVLGLLIGFVIKFNFILSMTLIIPLVIFLIFLYIKHSTPSFAVMFCAFADMAMTLACVNILGMQISSAGIVAFLMLIGYSVDTDILLTTRVLKSPNSTSAVFSSFKTGMTMTLTSIASVVTGLFVVYRFGTVLNQIFIILIIGLFFDMINTWVTNASIIKWYTDKK